MAATATKTGASILDQIEELRQQAAEQETEARDLMSQAQEKLGERSETLRKIGELYQQAAEEEPQFNGNGQSAQARESTQASRAPKRPTPKQHGRGNQAPAAKRQGQGKQQNRQQNRQQGRQAPAAKRSAGTAKKGGQGKSQSRKDKVAPHERNYGNEQSLRETIWNVLDRDPKSYKKFLPDYDAEVGLKVSEIKEIIEQEGVWQSSSANISPQIQGHLHDLKNDGKVARNDEDRRYYIVDGAEL